MRAFKDRKRGLASAIPGLLAVALVSAAATTATAAADDEPGFFGRLFRMGGPSPSRTAKHDHPKPAANPLPYGPAAGSAGAGSGAANRGNEFVPPAPPRIASTANGSAPAPAPTPTAGPMGEGPSTPEPLDSGSAPPIAPRSRVSSAVTSAEPVLTRVALGRSTDGSQFGMFLQVFADGTVIDSEGVHRMSPADVKPIADLVASGDLSRNRGHCGAPSSDFIEDVQVIVYERRLGRLAAQAFSYSGNPQDCDHSVKHLHALVEALQLKLSGQPDPASTAGIAAAAATAPTAPAPVVSSAAPAPDGGPPSNAPRLATPAPAPLSPSGPVIPLTPVAEH